MSKGSRRRPTDEKKYRDNYERVFNLCKCCGYIMLKKAEPDWDREGNKYEAVWYECEKCGHEEY